MLPLLSPRNLLDPGIKPSSLAWQMVPYHRASRKAHIYTHLLSGPEVLQGHTLAAVVFQVVAGGDLHMGGRGTGQHLSALAQKGLLFFWPLEDKKHPKLLKGVHSALLHQTEQSYFH